MPRNQSQSILLANDEKRIQQNMTTWLYGQIIPTPTNGHLNIEWENLAWAEKGCLERRDV